jgi:hypothetical protein
VNLKKRTSDLASEKSSHGLQYYFHVGICKNNLVYTEKIHDLYQLQERICAAVATVAPDIPCHTCLTTEYCLNVCKPAEILTLRLPVKEGENRRKL